MDPATLPNFWVEAARCTEGQWGQEVYGFAGLARQGRVAAREVGTVTPAGPDLF